MKKESSKRNQAKIIIIVALVGLVAISAVYNFNGIVAGFLDALK